MKIILKRLRFYANHGVLPSERTVGAWFTVDVEIETAATVAIESDKLAGTIDYAQAYEVVKTEMSAPSNLLEHVAGRIARGLLSQFGTAQSVVIRLIKDAPPILGIDCEGCGVELCLNREK